MNQCSRCKEVKKLIDFCADKKRKDGIRNVCKACVATWMREHRKRNPDSIRLARKKYYGKKKEEIKRKAREYYHQNSEKVKQTQKRYRQEKADQLKKKKSEWQRRHYQENKELYKQR